MSSYSVIPARLSVTPEEVLSTAFLRAVESVHPANLFRKQKCLEIGEMDGIDVLRLKNTLTNQLNCIPFEDKRIYVVGFGKAVLGMAAEVDRILSNRIVEGIISVPVGTLDRFKGDPNMKLQPNTRINVFEGAADNLPDIPAVETALRILKLARNLTSDDILIVLISGGGSALLPLPHPSLTLDEKYRIIVSLAKSGATIQELNTVRIALSQIKGGKLLAAASKAFKIISLIISDIVDDPLPLIASGPTVPFIIQPGMKTPQQILRYYRLWDGLDDEIKFIVKLFEAKYEHERKIYLNNVNSIIGSNQLAIKTATNVLKEYNYQAVCLTHKLNWNVTDISILYKRIGTLIIDYFESSCKWNENEFIDKMNSFKLMYADITDDKLKQIQLALDYCHDNRQCPGICLIIGGETTCSVTGNGVGGRNQELALRLTSLLATDYNKINDTTTIHKDDSEQQQTHDTSNSYNKFDNFYFLSAGTDGIDGPTTAAGAYASSHVIDDFSTLLPNDTYEHWINNNDSFNFYRKLSHGSHQLITGHTGTNVMDLHFLLIR